MRDVDRRRKSTRTGRMVFLRLRDLAGVWNALRPRISYACLPSESLFLEGLGVGTGDNRLSGRIR
jgi:hypothetical protein